MRILCILLLLTAGIVCPQSRKPYIESFDHGPGGWYADRYYALPVWDGIAYSFSPWWVDANHAPPGAGYLHMLMWTYTDKRWYQGSDAYTRKLPYKGARFAEENYSRDLTNATLTVRLRGELDAKGAKLVFLVQAVTNKTTANMALTGQPFRVTEDWTRQSVILRPDSKQWTCLGSRHDMTKDYGCDDIATVLKDVNMDIIFILLPIKVVPADKSIRDPNQPRAVADYVVDPQYLPKGLVMFDLIRIDYPN